MNENHDCLLNIYLEKGMFVSNAGFKFVSGTNGKE